MERIRYLIGTRAFYRKLMRIAVPIMIQNGITNFVNLLDNIMVGQLGTNQMSGVAIVNQLMLVFNLVVFGGLAGIGIFTAQYYGKGDQEGIRYTFRTKIILAAFICAAAFVILLSGGSRFISLYLHEDQGTGSLLQTMQYAKVYLRVMYLSMIPFALSTVYSDTLRETGETMVPMKAGLLAVVVNLIGNYILIFGHFGFPALGAAGAAAATALSRVAELIYVTVWTHRHTERNPFIRGIYRHFRIPGDLFVRYLRKAFPLLLNELLWTVAQTTLLQNYSVRGLTVVAAFNISNTLGNVMNVSFIAMGSAIAIMIGQELGGGRVRHVRQEAEQLAFASVLLCSCVGLVMFAFAGFFPRFYNTEEEVRLLAAGLIRISAVCMPMYAYENAAYFTIRSGGRVLVTFLFDSLFCWVFSVPAASILARFTGIPILQMFLLVQLVEIIKVISGFVLVRKGIWINNLT